jgi:hypothetical protein
MRRLGGLALILLGVLGVLVGAALAVGFGPDNRIGTGPHRLSTPGQAIVTAPEALAFSGPQVEVTVTSTEPGRALFLGVGHDVDVRDFLGETPRTRIDTIELPWRVTTTDLPGGGFPKGAPQDLGWWLAEAQGRGQAALTWRLPESAADLVILDPEGGDGLTVDVTAAVLAPGIFVVGLAVAVLGLGVVIFGWAVLTTRVAPRGLHARRPAPTEPEPAAEREPVAPERGE